MRRKMQICGLLILLVCAVIGSHKAGEYLYDNYMVDEGQMTAASAEKGDKPKIVIDSGHGGSDPGKVGINQALEKDINLQIAQKVKILLEKQGIAVTMTREDGNGLADSKVEDMKKRISIINETKPKLAVSIHQNSYGEESIHGAQVFYYSHSKEGEQAAKIMQDALLQAEPENTRQAKANDTYYMLKKTEVPVIIVEAGFLSNYEEAEKLVTEEYQEKVAETVCAGVMEYLE